VVLKLVSPGDKREDVVRGKITDVLGEAVRARLYEPGKPAFSRCFKKHQLRPGGVGTWRVTVAKGGEGSTTSDKSPAQR